LRLRIRPLAYACPRVPTCRPLRKRANEPRAAEDLDTFGLMPTSVNAHITGTVWKIEVAVGDVIAAGQVCVIIESMKMELPVEAPRAGRVDAIRVTEGQAVAEGDTLLTLA
jgi:acetyl-CoA carboxylase biotin carboxyl carrier protein